MRPSRRSWASAPDMRPAPIRVLIVDDSALVRKIVTDSLAHDPDILVVGTAVDPYVAREKLRTLNPDVMTLDIEMPRMDGVTFLKLVMQHRPMPVIVMSSLTQEGSAKALEALDAGAVDVIGKPNGALSACEDGTRLAQKIKAAAQAKIRFSPSSVSAASPVVTAPRRAPAASPPSQDGEGRPFAPRNLILMGASTGGTEALKKILIDLPSDLPGICIVQHIPAQFSLAFANRLNAICRLRVREARDGDRIEPGLALIAPGGQHMILRWTGSHYSIALNTGPTVHHQRPAVDVLFDSAVKCGAAPYALGILLTGMGADGAAGLLNLRQAGAATVAQNEETCVVFGMPREAILRGAAQEVLPLGHMATRINRHANESAHAPERTSSPVTA